MHQEFENLDMLMETLKGHLKSQDFGASKTIVNIYYEMLPSTLNALETTLKGRYKDDEIRTIRRHLKDFNEIDKETTNKAIPELIANGEFKSLHNLHYIQQKIRYFIKTLEHEYRQTYTGEQSNGKTRTLLDLSVNTGSLITQVKEDLRGTGKTTELIKKANELDASLIVGTHYVKNNIDTQAREMGYKIDCRYINSLRAVSGQKLKNGKFLVDDSTPNQLIVELVKNGNEFLGGFNSLNNSLTIQDKTLEFLKSKVWKLINERAIVVTSYVDNQKDEKLRMLENLNMKINFLEELLEEMKK